MSDAYRLLLEATIQQLESLRAEGIRFVPVTRATLESLATPATSGGAPAKRVAPSPTRPSFALPAPAQRSAPPSSRPPGKPAAIPTASQLLRQTAPPSAPRPVVPTTAKAAALEELRCRVAACTTCDPIAKSRNQTVFGVGNPNAELMFVGEAPGADEDRQGEPFVGKAGQLLTKIIQAMGLSRESVYIANILKCRPDTPGQSAGNRKPTPEEMRTCISYLHGQIDIIQPKVLVALGATAVEGLLGKTEGITRLRGNWRTYRDIPLLPTYHPAYLLRNQSLAERRRVWEDMLQVMEKLGLPISEKQRNFFRQP